MIILGISDMSQDSSACIVRDGRIVAAVSDERVTRLKHCGGFPAGAINDVLRIAGLEPGDVDSIAIGNTSAESLMRFSTHVFGTKDTLEYIPTNAKGYFIAGTFSTYRKLTETLPLSLSADQAVSRRILQLALRQKGLTAHVHHLDHHLSHAASAFYTSGFRKAIVLTLDAYGDGRSGALFVGKGKELEELESFSPEVSFGELYGAVTALLGYQFGNCEGKIMALAAFGRPELLSLWNKRLRVEGMSLQGDLTRKRRFLCKELIPLKRTHRPEDIAASAQALLEETVCELVENALGQTGCKRLCLAGGVALNVKMNQRLLELPGIKDIHVFPAPADDGTAVGAALLLSAREGRITNTRLTNTAFGPSYTRQDVEKAVRDHPQARRLLVSGYDSDSAARGLAEGKLIGWFHGKMEFGPRALGNRSLLADPRSLNSPQRIRKTIKCRPEFQPFCPSISTRYAKELLVNRKGSAAPFMALAFSTADSVANNVPAVVHVDGTTRPQVVQQEVNREYHKLLCSFGRQTGIEGVLNTSLNRSGEPIVRNPRDALDLLLNTDLDMLIMEGLTVTKSSG